MGEIIPVQTHHQPDGVSQELHKWQARRQVLKNLYMNNLPAHWREDDLRDLLRRYGPVRRMRFQTDGSTKGWALVELESLDAARYAKADLHGQDLGGRRAAVVEYNHPKPGRTYQASSHPTLPPECDPPPTANVYLNNLPVNWSQEELLRLLAPYGAVARVRLSSDPKHTKGWALAEFCNAISAACCVHELHAVADLPGAPRALVVEYNTGRHSRRPDEKGGKGGKGSHRKESGGYEPYPAPRPARVPPGWEEYESDEHPGHTYWHNASTGESTWQLPTWI
eukprot:TRINITY_DN20079_c0_g1_i1.p1 TRINITY_DN20079_c0_g1~~TRINITY_DN20079_c0_g1_i1.p1  ORF type:complete len:281 (+),score=4.08 TRINITY_DN20079_c0_g1_i1:142-984(+)